MCDTDGHLVGEFLVGHHGDLLPHTCVEVITQGCAVLLDDDPRRLCHSLGVNVAHVGRSPLLCLLKSFKIISMCTCVWLSESNLG